MQKPHDYDTVQAYTAFTPLEPGGYVCKIMGVEETLSQSKRDMLVISLDIAEGANKGYYAADYRTNTKPDKKWGCRVFQLCFDNTGETNRGLKTFLEAVVKSNAGYSVQWGDNFCASLQGKLVGGVFGREEYLKGNGEKGMATRHRSFRSVEEIRAGVTPPPDKLLDVATAPRPPVHSYPNGAPTFTASPSGNCAPTVDYEEIPFPDDQNLPF